VKMPRVELDSRQFGLRIVWGECSGKEAMNDDVNIETLNPLEDKRGAADVKRLLGASGLEAEADIEWRKKFLRQIGYKL